jgi:hypothetical protein
MSIMSDFHDRLTLGHKFEELIETLPGEGFPDDEITDAMIRIVCDRCGSRAAVLKRVERIAKRWFE